MKSKGSSSHAQPAPNVVPIDIQAAVCIRPLLKKERDDTLVLEAQQSSQKNQGDPGVGYGVALHPLPLKINSEAIAPSTALILQTLSPDTIHTGHDLEFRFDHVFFADAHEILHPAGHQTPSSTLPNQVYTRLGRPMALKAMEAIVHPKEKMQRKTQLLVTMGSPASGKSYLCWGPGSVPKRKSSQDGLILRTVDSFFGQFHRLQQKSSRGPHYALNLSFVQLNQKNQQPSDACELHDLLQSNHSSGSGLTVGRLSPHVKALVPSRWTSKGSTSASTGSQEGAEENLHLQQDRLTKDFHLVNGTVHTCRTMEEARETLQEALNNSRKHSNKKRHQSHVLVQMQPVILEKSKASSRVLHRGGIIAVLDMAGFDENVCQRRSRSKDSLPNQSDAHTALMHCLQSIQYNEQLRLGKTPLSDVMEDVDDEGTRMSEMTCSVMTAPPKPKDGLKRQQSFKQVPYPRHKLTMLLQPFFSSTFTDETTVTLILAASPGTRDYGEKKGLLQELESFVYPRMMPSQSATTGLVQLHKVPASRHEAREQVVKTDMMGRENHHGNRTPSKTDSHPSKPSSSARKHRHKPKMHSRMGSDADDEASEPEPELPRTKGLIPSPAPKNVLPGVFCDRKKGSAITPVVETAHSMAYSDTTDDEDSYSLPPPVAPHRHMRQPSPSARYLHSPSASAPPEKEVFGMTAVDEEEGIPGPPSMVPPLGPVERFASTNTSTTAMTSGSSDSNTSSMTSTSTAYFRPVQHTLKKVMHVGKKQCGKVWDKMSAATASSSETFTVTTTITPAGLNGLPPDEGPSVEARYAIDLADLQRRLRDCEQERDALRTHVQRLEQENNNITATSRDPGSVFRKKADPVRRTEVPEARDDDANVREVESPYGSFGGVQIPTLPGAEKMESPVYDRAYTGSRTKGGGGGVPQTTPTTAQVRADESPYRSFGGGGVQIPTLPGAPNDSPIRDRAYTGRRTRGGGGVPTASPPPPTAPTPTAAHAATTSPTEQNESPYRSFGGGVQIPTLPGVVDSAYDRVPTAAAAPGGRPRSGAGGGSLQAHMAKLQQSAVHSSSPHFSAVAGSHHTSASAPWNKW